MSARMNFMQAWGGTQPYQHPPCECHECTQARWRSSIYGQLQGAIPPPKVEARQSEPCPHCGKYAQDNGGKAL